MKHKVNTNSGHPNKIFLGKTDTFTRASPRNYKYPANSKEFGGNLITDAVAFYFTQGGVEITIQGNRPRKYVFPLTAAGAGYLFKILRVPFASSSEDEQNHGAQIFTPANT